MYFCTAFQRGCRDNDFKSCQKRIIIVNKKNAETSLNAILKGLITIKTSFYNTKERKKYMSEK